MGLTKLQIAPVKASGPRGGAVLVAELSSPLPAVRRKAARELSTDPGAVTALLARLAVEDDRSVRESLFFSLAQLGGPVAVGGLADCLRSENVALRNEAIVALQAMPHDVAPLMGTLLTDLDPDVRLMAVNVLEALQHPNVETWLIEVIERDAAVNVCGTAADLLSEFGTSASRDALVRLKARFSQEPYVQFAADIALKRIANAGEAR